MAIRQAVGESEIVIVTERGYTHRELAGRNYLTHMEITYVMIGTDGQQYGPVLLEQFKTWVGEGRVVADTKVMRSDTRSWLAAAQYPELGLTQRAPTAAPPPLPASPTSPLPPTPGTYDQVLARVARSGASWFYWIAGLSMVNALMTASGGGYFVVGLGVSLFLPMALGLVVAAMFAGLGFFAWKHHTWSFIVGLVLYAGDAVLFLVVQEWLGLAFHAYVLFRLFRGLQANLQLNAGATGGRV